MLTETQQREARALERAWTADYPNRAAKRAALARIWDATETADRLVGERRAYARKMALRGPRKTGGFILYRGPSLIDGAPIVVVATITSGNAKTGNVVQSWILADRGEDPTAAWLSGNDVSICGNCPHRGFKRNGIVIRKRSCYVTLMHGPRAVYDKLQRGETMPDPESKDQRPLPAYESLSPAEITEKFAGRVVRLGSYGDPAAAPRWVWEAMTARAAAWSGYTHQWKTGLAMADLCMASVETDAEAREAIALGYRVFQVVAPQTPRKDGFMVCPASEERGKVIDCARCKGCGGKSDGPRSRRGHVQIVVHGGQRRNALPVLQAAQPGRVALRVLQAPKRRVWPTVPNADFTTEPSCQA